MDSPVGFSAYATQNRDYNAGDLVLFDGVDTNIGGYYQSSSSTFLCPVDGVYVFSASLLTTEEDKYMTFRIMKEDVVIAGAFGEDIPAVRFADSAVAVTECLIGQKVWVKSIHDNSRMYGSAAHYSMFSGFLLTVH